MKQSVQEAFVEFSTRFEGCVPWLYLDILGLVSTGIGNLVDPIGLALHLPFVHKGTDTPATEAEIRAEWDMVKAHPTAAKQGHLVLQSLCQLRLTPAGIEHVVFEKLAINESILRHRFPDFDAWPADAQLATASMAWACGPAFHFPQLAAALLAGDFALAAKLCHIDDSHNPGVTPRNVANKKLYELAARVVAEGLDPEIMLYGSAAEMTLDDEPPTAA